MEQYQRGDQIVYIPAHARGFLEHPDNEFGFVTSQRGDTVFCRYWRKGHLGDLRTKANSEGTPIEYLKRRASVSDSIVQGALQWIASQEQT